MDTNKFSYKEVFVRYDNVQIGVVCSKMVEKFLNTMRMMMKMWL